MSSDCEKCHNHTLECSCKKEITTRINFIRTYSNDVEKHLGYIEMFLGDIEYHLDKVRDLLK